MGELRLNKTNHWKDLERHLVSVNDFAHDKEQSISAP